MRLGQLSRKLEVKPIDIQKAIKEEYNVEIGVHPNIKIDDEYLPFLKNKFKPEQEVEKKNSEEQIPELEKNKEIEQKSTEQFPEIKQDDIEKNSPTIDVENIEHIPTEQPKELHGPKIIGKIDLEAHLPETIEIDGVVYTREELKAKKEEEKRLAKEKREEEKRLARLKRQQAKEKKLKKELEALERKKKQKEKREKQLEEQKRKAEAEKKKKFYIENVAKKNKEASKKVKKKNIKQENTTEKTDSDPVIANKKEEVKNQNFLAKFWHWLTHAD